MFALFPVLNSAMKGAPAYELWYISRPLIITMLITAVTWRLSLTRFFTGAADDQRAHDGDAKYWLVATLAAAALYLMPA